MAPAQREPNVVVLGGGSWGTTVASICARRGPTLQWVRSQETADDINTHHRNTKYLGNEVELAHTLRATTDFAEAAECADVIVMGCRRTDSAVCSPNSRRRCGRGCRWCRW